MAIAEFLAADTDPVSTIASLRLQTQDLSARRLKAADGMAGSTAFHADSLLAYAEQARQLSVKIDHAVRANLRLLDLAEKQIAARDDDLWPTRDIGRARKALEVARGLAVDRLKQVRHFQRHAAWLIERFPQARFCNVQGLCKAATRAEIDAADWSLTPGRYVGVAAVEEDEDFDFADAMRDIHSELAELDLSAQGLSVRIQAAAAGLFA